MSLYDLACKDKIRKDDMLANKLTLRKDHVIFKHM